MIREKFIILIFILIPTLCYGLEYKPKEGLDIIGTKAPEFEGLTWLNTEPLTMEDLKGKVVLIRFWLVQCSYCNNTSYTLVDFHKRYSDKGLVIIGIHHPKNEPTKDNNLVKKQAEAFGFKFPVAQDTDWKTINSFWLRNKKRSFTSSSLLIDKTGTIRFVHDGGNYFKSDYDLEANAAYNAMETNIVSLLKQ